jgi:fido (protein-threonine AMPylation protein)
MIDRYLLHTREHQAELRLDAIQQRLIAQARQSRATQKRTSRTVSRIVGLLHSVRALHPWRLGDVRSA